MADSIFGLEIGEKHTKIVDLTLNNGKINLSAMGVVPTVANFYSDDTEKSIENQADIISKLCNDLKITKKNVSIVMPDNQSFFQIMEFAKLNEKELLSAVRYQSDQFIPMPIDEVVLDIEVLKEDKTAKKNTILIVASPKKTVDRIEKTAEMMGLVPLSLENDLSVIGRIMTEVVKPKGNGCFLIVNVGYNASTILLVDSATSMILLTRTVKVGYELFLKELKFNLELPETKATEVLKTIGFEKNASYDVPTIVSPIMQELLTEISKFFVQSKEKFAQPVTRIFLYDYAASVLSFDKKITEATSLPAENLYLRDVLVNNPISQSFAASMPEYISAIGACIR